MHPSGGWATSGSLASGQPGSVPVEASLWEGVVSSPLGDGESFPKSDSIPEASGSFTFWMFPPPSLPPAISFKPFPKTSMLPYLPHPPGSVRPALQKKDTWKQERTLAWERPEGSSRPRGRGAVFRGGHWP